MTQGYQRHESEEVALPMFILLKPEPEANEKPWQQREHANLERRHRNTMGPPADDQEQSLRPRPPRDEAQVFGAPRDRTRSIAASASTGARSPASERCDFPPGLRVDPADRAMFSGVTGSMAVNDPSRTFSAAPSATEVLPIAAVATRRAGIGRDAAARHKDRAPGPDPSRDSRTGRRAWRRLNSPHPYGSD